MNLTKSVFCFASNKDINATINSVIGKVVV